jgi:cyclophilin family peptidyl-prolyl cis-trans isomerase/FKBP-type peptidyl-prolyl cis-trans isomerase 2
MKDVQLAELSKWDLILEMKTTNGIIKIKMFNDIVPITVTNFLVHAKKWYYDGIIFHRIIKDFMIQWGDPDGTGMWWKSIYWQTFEDEFSELLTNIPYSISMANAWPNTNGSQFFINTKNNTHLNQKHSVFWQVIDWFDNVDKIEKTRTGQNDKPVKDIKIISTKIMQYDWEKTVDFDYNIESELEKIDKLRQEKLEANKTKVIKKWDNIAVHYTGTLENGDKFDSSHDRDATLDFTVWVWQMIIWFDEAVIWMKIWEKKSITLQPEEAYGWKEQKVPEISFTSFVDAGIKLEAGAKLPTNRWEIKIIDVKDWFVIIENNHELAWKVLKFDIEIVDIK